jgi:hypothetical protein
MVSGIFTMQTQILNPPQIFSIPFLNLYSYPYRFYSTIGGCYYGVANYSYSQSLCSSSSSVVSVHPLFREYGIPEPKGHYSMSDNIHNNDAGLEMGPVSTDSHHNDNQISPTNGSIITNVGINKRTPSKKARAVNKVAKTKVKVISKKRISRDRQIEPTQEEFRRQNETDILSRIISLETGLIDLLCHFSRAEIDVVWDSMMWLYPDLMSKGATIPEMELMKVMV